MNVFKNRGSDDTSSIEQLIAGGASAADAADAAAADAATLAASEDDSDTSRRAARKADRDDPMTWRVGWYANLLPAEIAAKERARHERVLYLAVGMLLLIALSLAHVYYVMQVGVAQERVAEAEAGVDDLRARIADLDEVVRIERDIAAAEQLAELVLSPSADPAPIVDDLRSALPGGSTVSGVTLTLAQDVAVGPHNLGTVTPFGRFQVSGAVRSPQDAVAYAQRLNALPYAFYVQVDSVAYDANTDSYLFKVAGVIDRSVTAASIADTEEADR